MFNHVELDLPKLSRETIDGVRYYSVPDEGCNLANPIFDGSSDLEAQLFSYLTERNFVIP